LYASGLISVVPNLTTLKFTPQMSAIATSDRSVNQTPGRIDVVEWPGVTDSSAVEPMYKK